MPLPPPTLLQTVTDGGSCNTFFISMFCTARQTILGSALRSFTPTFYGYSLRFAPLDVVSCAKAPGVSPLAAPRQRQLQPAPSTVRLTQAMLQVDTFEELLSHVFGGCVLKAATPRQHRMGVNLRSYQSRAWEIARYLAKYPWRTPQVRPIVWIDDAPPEDVLADTWCDMWPTASPRLGPPRPGPQTSRKADSDTSPGKGPAPRDPYERNSPLGPPSGPLAVGLNTLSGPLRPQHQGRLPMDVLVFWPAPEQISQLSPI